MKHSDLMSI